MRVNVSYRIYQGAAACAAIALAVTIAGCGQEAGSGAQAEPESSRSPSQAGATQLSPGSSVPADTPAPTTKPAEAEPGEPGRVTAEPGLCTAADLQLSLGTGSATAGTHYAPLRFTNAGDSQCVVHGFPGVSYVAGDDGHQVGPAAYREGTKGDPVALDPGEVAHAVVGFVQVRNYDPGVCRPTPVRGLRVYPPQETESMFLRVGGREGCASDDIPGNQLTVRTIEPGPGGR